MRFTILTILALVPLQLALASSSSDSLARAAQHKPLARSLPITPEQRRAREAPQAPAQAKKAKRNLSKGKGKRCRPKGSSSSASSTSSVAPANVGGQPTENPSPPTSTSAQDPPTTTSTTTTTAAPPPPTSTSTTAAAAPTTSASGTNPDDPGGILTGPHSGDGTYYADGLGACGITNADSDPIVAVSYILFDSYPGYAGTNPNNNPVCGKKITATYGGVSQTVTVVDRCTGCAEWDLDFSTSIFDGFADPAVGRIHGVTWNWA